MLSCVFHIFLCKSSFWRFIYYFSSLFYALLVFFGDFILFDVPTLFFNLHFIHISFLMENVFFILTKFHLPQNNYQKITQYGYSTLSFLYIIRKNVRCKGIWINIFVNRLLNKYIYWPCTQQTQNKIQNKIL